MSKRILFTVQVLLPFHQHIRLVGSTRELGQWSPFESFELQRERKSQDKTSTSHTVTYSIEVDVGAVDNFTYRYLVCEKLKGNQTSNVFTIVKYGPLSSSSVTGCVEDDGVFDVNDKSWVDGWLLHETEVHLTIHNSCGFPIRQFQQCMDQERFRIKISKINDEDPTCSRSEETPCGVITKVVGEYSCFIGEQEDTGICYDSTKHYSFIAKVLNLYDAIFKIELYYFREDGGDVLGGCGFIHSVNLKGSRGVVDVSISKNKCLVASIQVEYLVIKPLLEKSFHNMDDLVDRNWQNDSRTLNMGHRGCGSTFSSSLRYDLQENTIESFITACKKGGDGVELDVHITKDLVPVIYHDLDVSALFVTKEGRKVPYTLPVHQITYKELQEIKIEHTKSEELNNELVGRTDLNRKIAPTLQEVLATLPDDYPMELEVKYLETEKDDEDKPFVDVNLYVDTILNTVLPNIGKRKIILMSFSTVITQLMNRKQKKVPVKIAVCGETPKYAVFKDIRIRTVGRIMAFAQCERLLGVSCFCDQVIDNPKIVDEMKKRNLVLSTWGEDNNLEDIREKQRKMGVNVLCFDRIHEKVAP